MAERIYSIRGRSAATTAASGEAICQLWNADTNNALTLYELGISLSGNVCSRVNLARTTARGTAGSTETPDGDNAWAGDGVAPLSGALLDLADFTTNPTYAAPRLEGWARDTTGARTGSEGWCFVWTFPDGVEVAQSSGVAVEHVSAAADSVAAAECYAVWGEEG